jgi:anti-anti-sigma regulatory factor
MSQSLKLLKLAGSLTVERAASIRADLLSLLSEYDVITLDLSKVTDVDLSFVQLLYAAASEAVRLGKELSFSGKLSKEVRAALQVGGFCSEAPEDAGELISALFDYEELSPRSPV